MFSKDVEGCLSVEHPSIDPSVGHRTTGQVSDTFTGETGQIDDRSSDTLELMSRRMISMLQIVVNLASLSLKQHQRLSVNALLTIYVHCRDVVGMLVGARVTSIGDFQWSRYRTFALKNLKTFIPSSINARKITNCSFSR